ncbi:large subunit ribosomal protein L18Ae [Nematocida sp. AWRm80]|nr:large subunit ribosomal protein L18Ae [Nematocida sp. AWRm80]
MHLKEYKLYISQTPSEKNVSPQIYECTAFAKNEVIAKGMAFKLLRAQYKIKATHGTVLKIEEVPQYTDMKARTFEVFGVYMKRNVYQNVKKEIRALSRADAVAKLFHDIKMRHNANHTNVSIISVSEVQDSDVTNGELLQILKAPKYPLFDNRLPKSTSVFVRAALDRA